MCSLCGGGVLLDSLSHDALHLWPQCIVGKVPMSLCSKLREFQPPPPRCLGVQMARPVVGVGACTCVCVSVSVTTLQGGGSWGEECAPSSAPSAWLTLFPAPLFFAAPNSKVGGKAGPPMQLPQSGTLPSHPRAGSWGPLELGGEAVLTLPPGGTYVNYELVPPPPRAAPPLVQTSSPGPIKGWGKKSSPRPPRRGHDPPLRAGPPLLFVRAGRRLRVQIEALF